MSEFVNTIRLPESVFAPLFDSITDMPKFVTLDLLENDEPETGGDATCSDDLSLAWILGFMQAYERVYMDRTATLREQLLNSGLDSVLTPDE